MGGSLESQLEVLNNASEFILSHIIQKWEKNDNGGKRKHIQVLIPPTLINVLTYFISVGFTSKPPKAFKDCCTVSVYFYTLDVNVDSYGPFKILCYFMYKHNFCMLQRLQHTLHCTSFFTLLSTGASIYCTVLVRSLLTMIFFISLLGISKKQNTFKHRYIHTI